MAPHLGAIVGTGEAHGRPATTSLKCRLKAVGACSLNKVTHGFAPIVLPAWARSLSAYFCCTAESSAPPQRSGLRINGASTFEQRLAGGRVDELPINCHGLDP